jgi:hypothetical protein
VHAFPRAVVAPRAEVAPDRREGAETHAARHAHSPPVRSRYKMALITSRMSVVRGCPPGLAGGMSGSRMAHSFSVKSTSVAEPFHCSTSSIFPLFLLLFYSISLFTQLLNQQQARCINLSPSFRWNPLALLYPVFILGGAPSAHDFLTGLPLAISAWAVPGRSVGNASSHSGTMLTTRLLDGNVPGFGL